MDSRIDGFLHYLSVEKGFSANTIAAYRNDLSQLWGFMKEEEQRRGRSIGWASVDRNLLVRYVLSRKERDYATSTIARKVAAVKSFYSFLKNEGTVKADPSELLNSPKLGRSLPKAISLEEINLLLAQPQHHHTPEGQRDTAMLELLYASGMRVSELVSLNLEDVNLTEGNVRCLGKGSKERIIPIHRQAVQAISAYLQGARPQLGQDHREKALFLNRRGERLTRQGVWLILKNYAREANIATDITPHVVRHTFATHMLRGGAPLRHVQELLGHANISTTQVYTHLTSEHMRQEYDKAHPRAWGETAGAPKERLS